MVIILMLFFMHHLFNFLWSIQNEWCRSIRDLFIYKRAENSINQKHKTCTCYTSREFVRMHWCELTTWNDRYTMGGGCQWNGGYCVLCIPPTTSCVYRTILTFMRTKRGCLQSPEKINNWNLGCQIQSFGFHGCVKLIAWWEKEKHRDKN